MSSKKLIPLLFFLLLLPQFAWSSEITAITTQPIHDLIIFPKIEAPATVISLNDAVISAEINGIILELPYQVGETVQKGDTLARIACQDYELTAQQINAQIQASHAKIEFTKWKLNRVKSLATGNNVSQEQLKELQSNLTSLSASLASQEAQLNQAKLQINRCEIKAPFTGIVAERLIDMGEMATPGRQVIHLVDNGLLEISAQLQPSEIQKLQTAQSPVFMTKDGEYPVRIRAAVGIYSKRYRTQEVRCQFINHKPLPGAVGRLVWHDNQPHLPAYLLSQFNDELGIFVVENSKAKFLAIKGAIEGRPIPIPSELESDIAVDGRYQLSDGRAIIVKEPEIL